MKHNKSSNIVSEKKRAGVFCISYFQFILGVNIAFGSLNVDECDIFALDQGYTRISSILHPDGTYISKIFTEHPWHATRKRFLPKFANRIGDKIKEKLWKCYRFHSVIMRNDYNFLIGTSYASTPEKIARNCSRKPAYYVIDDGTLTLCPCSCWYWGDMWTLLPQKRNTHPEFSDIFLTSFFADYAKKLYPEENILSMPLISENKSVINAIREQFRISENQVSKILNLPGIYFHQVFENRSDDFISYEKKLLRRLEDEIPGLCIKMHPTISGKSEIDLKNVFSGDTPWEVIMSYGNVEDIILISINSTSLMTAKNLYNQEPCLLILHKMLYDDRDGVGEYILKILSHSKILWGLGFLT